jgi:hypothetical protein
MLADLLRNQTKPALTCVCGCEEELYELPNLKRRHLLFLGHFVKNVGG